MMVFVSSTRRIMGLGIDAIGLGTPGEHFVAQSLICVSMLDPVSAFAGRDGIG